MCGNGNCGGMCVVCKVVGGIVTLLLTLTTIATFVGVYRTHFLPTGMVFGAPEGSLALVAFILSLIMWKKSFHKMCGCGSKGCGCGAPGMCPKCGMADCKCKNGK